MHAGREIIVIKAASKDEPINLSVCSHHLSEDETGLCVCPPPPPPLTPHPSPATLPRARYLRLRRERGGETVWTAGAESVETQPLPRCNAKAVGTSQSTCSALSRAPYRGRLTPPTTPSPRLSILDFKNKIAKAAQCMSEPRNGCDNATLPILSFSQSARGTFIHSPASLRGGRDTVLFLQTQTPRGEAGRCGSSVCTLWAP